MGGFFQNKKAVIIGGVILGSLIIIFGAAGFFLTQEKADQSAGVLAKGVSGIINVNGIIPPGSTITLLQRETQSKQDFVPFAENISPTDLNYWTFRTGQTGKSYEIQGSILQNGKVIYLSDPIFATAPAINQLITFDVAVPNPTGPANSIISGSVGINGYIPTGATITLQGRKIGAQKFTVVSQGVQAKDEQFISYTTAIAGQTYEVQALLFDTNGQLIGESALLEVTAPAANEKLSVNSLATPPATSTPIPSPTLAFTPTPTFIVTQVTPLPSATATPTPTPSPTPVPPPVALSGVIQFNGQAPSNSRIVIFQRPTGTQNYQVAVDNLAPENGVTWQWNGAQSGQMYDTIAILKQRQSNGSDTDIADSNVNTLAAPASNEVFTINSGYTLSAPTGGISVNCNNYNSSNQTWNVTVSFGNMTNAQSYWYQIGITNGGVELTNFTQNATQNNNQSFNQVFNNNVTYYARYAYANVPNLSAGNSQFSPFNSTTQLRCSQ